ncbi:MAG: IMP dehydrogenase [Candidatus Spechtbacterales bacterium]|nr:IMP dehydrogenase [Candidatus Spechtbacterales bacterium]
MSTILHSDWLRRLLYKMGIEYVPTELTFDDILVYPQERSEIPSRRDDRLTLFSQISPNITLKMPVIASPMDTVCEHEMAIACARNGGLGLIHRHLTIPEQVKQIELVKRAESLVIPEPYSVSPDTTLSDVKRESKDKGVGGFLVQNDTGELLGVISEHDIDLTRLLTQEDIKTHEAMTPLEKLILGDPDINLERAVELMLKHRVKKIPLVDSSGRVAGLVSKKSILRLQNPLAVRDSRDRLAVGAALGLDDRMMERAGALVEAGVDILALFVANGYLKRVEEATRDLKRNFPDTDLAVGSVADYHGVERLFDAGADAAFVGIGPGSICETREVAGVGRAQFTALRLAQRAARKHGKFILADGGVSKQHHFVKAIFAGASATVLGKVFAGTDEAPPELRRIDGRWVKYHRGLASDDAKQQADEIYGKVKDDVDPDSIWEYVYKNVHAEGVESGFVEYTGSAQDAIRSITGGLRSCMTYLGTWNIEEFWQACNRGRYSRITDSGSREGKPHDLLGFTT